MKAIKLFNFPKDQQVLVVFNDEIPEINITTSISDGDDLFKECYTISSYDEYLPLRVIFEAFNKEQAKEFLGNEN